MTIELTDQEFSLFKNFIYEAAGISLSDGKKPLVSGRLAKRLQQRQINSYSEYFSLLKSGLEPEEVQTAVDLLTTNETYFFREQKHFDLLRQTATAARARKTPFRVWSAACSTGEEPYSIAMMLEDCLPGEAWEVFASDISTRVLQAARRGHYVDERVKHIPPSYRQRFCLKGVGEQKGTLLVERNLRTRVQFFQANLNNPPPQIGSFDIIFLRNVMIYFDDDTKRRVMRNILPLLKPGGYLFVGHSESLASITNAVKSVKPAIYVKP